METKQYNLKLKQNTVRNAQISRFIDKRKKSGYTVAETFKVAIEDLMEKEEYIRNKNVDIDINRYLRQGK